MKTTALNELIRRYGRCNLTDEAREELEELRCALAGYNGYLNETIDTLRFIGSNPPPVVIALYCAERMIVPVRSDAFMDIPATLRVIANNQADNAAGQCSVVPLIASAHEDNLQFDHSAIAARGATPDAPRAEGSDGPMA